MTLVPNSNIAKRTWTDWVGFLCFSIIAVNLLVRSPQIGLLLLPTLLHEMMTAVSFIIRCPLRAEQRGLTARVAAYGGSFIVPLFLEFARRLHSDWIVVSSHVNLLRLAFVIWFAGAVLGVWAVWHLRTAFSIVPQARQLVTTGPYRFARHPIYAAYLLQYVGTLLAFASVPFALVLTMWLAFVVVRIHFEERVLQSSFPKYERYRANVGVIGLRPFRFSAVNGFLRTIAALALGTEPSRDNFNRQGER